MTYSTVKLLSLLAIIAALSGCVVDPWPDPKGDAYWGTTSTPVPPR